MATSPRDRQGVRTAWLALGSVVAILTLGWGTLNFAELLAYAEKQTHVTFNDAIRSVDIDNESGSTRIVGTDDEEIVVDATVKYGFRDPTNEASIEGDELVVRSSCPGVFLNSWCSVDYTIYVPKDVAVTVHGSGGGIRVEQIAGAVSASSSGGGVRVVGAGGDLHLRSSGGGIRADDLRSPTVDASSSGGGVRLSFVEPPTMVDADSSGGGVTVVVPSPYAYNIDASSSGGGVDISDVRHDPLSTNVIEVDSSGGGVTVRYPTSE